MIPVIPQEAGTAFHFFELSKARQRISASHTYLHCVYTSSQLLGPGTEAAARLEFPDFSNLVAFQESLICQIPSEVGICQSGSYSFCDHQCQCKAGVNSLLLSSAAPYLLSGLLLECLCCSPSFVLSAPLLRGR